MKPLLFLLTCLFCFSSHAETNDWKYYQKHGHKSKNWNQMVERGFASYEAQDCNSAIEHLTQAVQNDCKDALVYFKLATCSEATGSGYTAEQYYLLAEAALPKLKSPHPYQHDIYESMGRLYYSQKKIKQAMNYLNKAAQSGQPSFLVLFLLAQQAIQSGQDQKALEYFERMVQLSEAGLMEVPKDKLGIAYQSLAEYYFNQKDYIKADLLLQKAISLIGKNTSLSLLESKLSLIKQQGKLIENLQKIDQKVSK